jgi:hypothetical protein
MPHEVADPHRRLLKSLSKAQPGREHEAQPIRPRIVSASLDRWNPFYASETA